MDPRQVAESQAFAEGRLRGSPREGTSVGEPQAPWYELDVGEVTVEAGGRANVTVQPREAFRPARLAVLPEAERGFVVDELWVGKTCLWRGPLPAAEVAGAGVPLTHTQTVTPSEFVTVAVSNTSDTDLVFRAVVSGPLAP
jgi:hypothetical protein